MTQPTSSFRYDIDPAGCWIWDGYCDSNGYARIWDRDRRKIAWAHRYSYETFNGPLKPRHEIDHTCQVTQCVNPAHLDQVTRSEHARRTWERLGSSRRHLAAAHLRRLGMTYQEIADALDFGSFSGASRAVKSAIEKGLIDPEELPPVQRLNEVEREDIRNLWAFGVPQVVIAESYGIDDSHVSRICSGRTTGRKSA